MRISEHRSIYTDVQAVVRRADGSMKQHIHQVDDLNGHLTVLRNERYKQRSGGYLGNPSNVLLMGAGLPFRFGGTKPRHYSVPARTRMRPLDVLRLLASVGIVTRDGLGDAAALLVSDVTIPSRYDAVAVGTSAAASITGYSVPDARDMYLKAEVPTGDASGMTRRSGASVTGSLVQTTVTGPKNALADTSQWVTTFSASGAIGINEVGVLNSATVPAKSTLAATITSGSTGPLTVASGTDFPASGDIFVDDEVIGYASKSGNDLQTLTRGKYGTTAAAHNTTGVNVYQVVGNLLLRQVFAAVLNLVNTDTLQLTLKVQHS